ncbi:tripeptidyl peptidase A protein [Rutstroemia sp. NJR-2017a WRK4]|nr:tripeptidyl peptidase A protein [Rutstroemia sp. NJR-2017a WRK4]
MFNITEPGFSVETIDDGVNNQTVSLSSKFIGESNLDVQTIVGISHPSPVREYITGGSPPLVPNLDQPTSTDNNNEPYLLYYEYLLPRPNYDLPQVISNSYGDDEQTVPLKYAQRVCNMIGMVGLRGISVLESSGDSASVGGTSSIVPESSWEFGSSGFSNYLPRPSYQEAAVH